MSPLGRIDDLLEPYRPGTDGPFDFAEAAHLMRRTGFGAAPAEIAAAAAAGPQAAVDALFAAPRAGEARAYEQALAISERAGRRRDVEALQAAWVLRFLTAPQPLAERLALFWHGHFATSEAKVRDATAMHAQNLTLLEKGLGRFPELLDAVARDPAMLRWLDGDTNTKGRPNENFARELFELFTLGLGHFEEHDIREAARAFTGWRVKDGRYYFDAPEHDATPKRVFGKDGIESGEEVLALCTRRPECPRFIAVKLYVAFVAPAVDAGLAVVLGERFAALEQDVGAFLRLLFRSRVFYSAGARLAVYRSPVAFAAGAARTLSARADCTAIAAALADMGQALFFPPSVGGWEEGRGWISTATIAARRRFAADLGRGAAGPLALRTPPELTLDARELALALSGDASEPARPLTGEALLEKASEIMRTPRYNLL
jgi:uncharacterized protein (DUF1800 family)